MIIYYIRTRQLLLHRHFKFPDGSFAPRLERHRIHCNEMSKKNVILTLLTRPLIFHKPNTSGTCAGTTISIQQTQMTASSISG